MATKKTAPARKTAAKKGATSKRSATKTAATKAPAKKAAAKKAPAQKSTSANGNRGDAPRAAAAKKPTGGQIAREAAAQLLELTGREVEGITGFKRTDDGWTVEVEVLEVRRIPDTTDVLALYEVTVDEDGDMEGYRRVKRYTRGQPGEE